MESLHVAATGKGLYDSLFQTVIGLFIGVPLALGIALVLVVLALVIPGLDEAVQASGRLITTNWWADAFFCCVLGNAYAYRQEYIAGRKV